MTAVALIPARSGSKRIPGKNTRLLAGHPVIAYTIASAISSGVFDRVIVSTDDAPTAAVATYYGAEAPFLRPAELSQSDSADILWVLHALDWLDNEGELPDVCALLRPTSPLRQPASIRQAMDQFTQSDGYDSIRAVTRCEQHPAKMWVLDEDRLGMSPLLPVLEDAVPAHSRPYDTLPEVYVQDASLEIFWTRTARELGSIAGTRIMAWITPSPEGMDLNFPADWTLLADLVAREPSVLPTILQPPYQDQGMN
ncbi:MAG: acylneuraminate cytidylyltransferase family protein [Actinomycetota bacterium]|nr:acylneuraminate cytidylyltransferase family protein [Actinomycetota bacterium]